MTEPDTAPDMHTSPPRSEVVLLDLIDGVATVTFNRPDAMNALDIATKDLLLATLRQVAEDPAVRCVVLTGTGLAFCVGQDLREHIGLLAGNDDSLWTTVPEHYNPIVKLLSTMNKPVIAAIQRCRGRRRSVLRLRRRPAHHRRHRRLQPGVRRHRALL